MEITARYPMTLPEEVEDLSPEEGPVHGHSSERVYRAVGLGPGRRAVGIVETDELDEHVTREAALYVQGQSDGTGFRNALIASAQRKRQALPRWAPAPDPRRPILWAFLLHVVVTAVHVVLVMALGAVAVFCARLLRVAFVDAVAPFYEVQLTLGAIHFGLLIDFGLALAIGKVLGDLSAGNLTYAGRYRMVGIYAVFTLMHNLVWWFPDEMRTIYSEEWVEEIEAVSEPNSVFVFARSIPFETVVEFLESGTDEETRSEAMPRIFGPSSGGAGAAVGMSRFVSAFDRERTTPGFQRELDLRREN